MNARSVETKAQVNRRGLRGYARWLRHTPLHPQWLMPKRAVGNKIRECRGTVLDIGAANRWLCSQLTGAAVYIAFDYPVTAIGLYGTRPDVFGDARSLPFAKASFEAVACYEVLEHVQELESVVAEIARVLAPGGVAELTMPFMYPVHDAPHDYQRWTRHGWARSLANCGLEVEWIKATSHPLHAAAVMACLSLAGPLQHVSRFSKTWRIPFVLAFIPLINLSAWSMAWAWPAWGAMTIGHRVLVRKPI